MDSRPHGPANDASAFEAHAREVEARCRRYQAAFEHILHERFTDLDSTLSKMLKVLAFTLGVERVSHWLFEHADTAIRCTHKYHASGPGAGPDRIREDECPAYFAALRRQLVVDAGDAMTDERTRELAASYLMPLGITSMLDVPVVAFGQFVGVLCHEHIGPARQWTPEEQHFATCIATQVALAHERDHARRAQEALLQRSLRDEESQLPNSVHLATRLEDGIPVGSGGIALAVTSVDQHGYLVGILGAAIVQQWIREFARQLSAAAPPGGFAARISPNEFALLIPDVPPDAAEAMVTQWTSRLSAPLEAGDRSFFLTFSTGFSHAAPGAPRRAEELRAEARLAAQQARSDGGGRVVAFQSSMRERLLERAAVEQDLRRGLDKAEFALHYQPIVNLSTGRCVALEALLRWNHPTRGMIRPEAFLPVALETGIMLELGRRVVRAACRDLPELRRRTGMPALAVSVNMSAPEVLLSGTADVISEELARANLSPGSLTLEVTESAFIMDLDRAREALAAVRALGVHVSLDDFGTAYSSLSWLRELPVDEVKIDRAFVAGITTDARDLAIVRGVASLGQAFARSLVAEGIETHEQLLLLKGMGLTLGQGYLFAEPVAIDRIDAAWVERIARVVTEGGHENRGQTPLGLR